MGTVLLAANRRCVQVIIDRCTSTAAEMHNGPVNIREAQQLETD